MSWIGAARYVNKHGFMLVNDQTGALICDKQQMEAVLSVLEDEEYDWHPALEAKLRGVEQDAVLLDGFTASMLVQVYDALGTVNKIKFDNYPLTKAVNVGWKLTAKCKAS
jgi:hypothetical protein